ncbi:hypothetical protein AK973_2667 [Pseudomonas brassicacearum]|nr:hypothetical protein AK973_2667 [Pseudomonas brassicacearum]
MPPETRRLVTDTVHLKGIQTNFTWHGNSCSIDSAPLPGASHCSINMIRAK